MAEDFIEGEIDGYKKAVEAAKEKEGVLKGKIDALRTAATKGEEALKEMVPQPKEPASPREAPPEVEAPPRFVHEEVQVPAPQAQPPAIRDQPPLDEVEEKPEEEEPGIADKVIRSLFMKKVRVEKPKR
jgi:hypothetical protein